MVLMKFAIDLKTAIHEHNMRAERTLKFFSFIELTSNYKMKYQGFPVCVLQNALFVIIYTNKGTSNANV